MTHPGMMNEVKSENKDFRWTENNLTLINKILNKYPLNRKQSAVIAILDLAQRQNGGHLTRNAIEKVAETIGSPFIRVMEIATFYSMFNLQPIGKYFVQICRTTPCWLRGSNNLFKVAEDVTGCKIGQTSKDKKFTVVEVECLGACCNAPMAQINDEYYEDLNENNFKELLNKLRDNKQVSSGSQIGRKSSEPKLGSNND